MKELAIAPKGYKKFALADATLLKCFDFFVILE
jgi:hypothetical protein